MRRASDFGRESEFSVHVCYNVPLLLRHTVPSCRGEDAKGKDRGWYEAALHDGNPIIVYLHGSAEHRSAPLLGFFSSFKERGSGSARWGKGRRSSVFVSVLPHTSFFLLWKFEGVLAIGFSLKNLYILYGDSCWSLTERETNFRNSDIDFQEVSGSFIPKECLKWTEPMDDGKGNQHEIWGKGRASSLSTVVSQKYMEIPWFSMSPINPMYGLPMRDPLEGTGDHLTGPSLEDWCLSPLPVVPTLLGHKECLPEVLIPFDVLPGPPSGPVIMVGDDYQLWLHHFGLGEGQCASETHRPKLCVWRDIADLVTSSGICPLAPLPMSLFLTVFFCLDGFLKACLCTRGLPKMSILEWHVQRFPMKLNILQHCWTLFWWCRLGHYVFKGSFGPPIHACPSVWICSDRRFTGSGVSPSFLLSPAESLSWLSAVLSQRSPNGRLQEPCWEQRI